MEIGVIGGELCGDNCFGGRLFEMKKRRGKI